MPLQAPSIEIGPTGTLKLYKSLQAYEFNKQGMTRNTMTSPLATGAAAMQQSYQVRSPAKPHPTSRTHIPVPSSWKHEDDAM